MQIRNNHSKQLKYVIRVYLLHTLHAHGITAKRIKIDLDSDRTYCTIRLSDIRTLLYT